MIVQLGYTTSENSVIDKDFHVIETVNAILKEGTSIINPTLYINTPPTFTLNYIYIADTGRYYYIDNITALTGGRVSIVAHVDVLKTYASDIRNMKAVLNKQQNDNHSNLYYEDGSTVVESRSYNTAFNFPNSFNNSPNYILICAGGV